MTGLVGSAVTVADQVQVEQAVVDIAAAQAGTVEQGGADGVVVPSPHCSSSCAGAGRCSRPGRVGRVIGHGARASQGEKFSGVLALMSTRPCPIGISPSRLSFRQLQADIVDIVLK